MMRALSASELLDAWDRGSSQSPTRRALTLLQAACPEASFEHLARLTIGRRDIHLLLLRELIFGPQLSSIATCSACTEQLELEFLTTDLRGSSTLESPDEIEVMTNGYEMKIRPPTSLDLMSVASEQSVDSARAALLARCVSSLRLDGIDTEIASLPDGLVEIIEARMSETDPHSDPQLSLKCPACGTQWLAAFNIESFFWTEICSWAARLLNEVHVLAAAYGWSESEILAMSARRRQCYLNLVA